MGRGAHGEADHRLRAPVLRDLKGVAPATPLADPLHDRGEAPGEDFLHRVGPRMRDPPVPPLADAAVPVEKAVMYTVSFTERQAGRG